MIRIELPWPDKRLSPNARVHHMTLHRAKRTASDYAFYVTYNAGLELKEGVDRVPIRWTFHPPDNRRRDLDNLVASMKAAADGIALALGIDDSRFAPQWQWGEPEKPGRVEVQIG